MDYGLNTSLAAVELPNAGWAPPTTYILPPWELTPASCLAVVIGVLVDQESLEISYTSFSFDAEAPSVPPMAYTWPPEWPATRPARRIAPDASAIAQTFGSRSYISTS